MYLKTMTKKYQGLDFLEMGSLYSSEQRQIQERIRQFVDEEFLPHLVQSYRQGVFPIQVVEPLAKLGALGCFLEGYGCAGLSATDYGIIMMELERGDSGLRSFASVQSSLVMYPIWKFGSEEQKEKFLPGMAAGKTIGCFGLSEPDFGSNPSGMLTEAKQTAAGFVLNGTKRWLTNGSLAQVAVIWAKLNGKVQGFLVPTDTPGLQVHEIEGKLSLRASVTSEIRMQDCEVRKDALLPGARGLRAAFECLNSARYGIVWGAIGAAMDCYHEALYYAKEREVFGEPLANKQLIQQKLVWMLNEITKAQLLAWRLAQLKEANELKPQQISLGKMNNVARALEIARMARDILGGNGICDEYRSMRHACNLESVNTYEGTHDIHSLIIGEAITGHAAF